MSGAGDGGPAGHAGAGGGGGFDGAAGAGGSASGPTCDDLSAAYAAAMPQARTCTVGAANQCRVSVPGSLSRCSGCEVYVNDATQLNAIRMQWSAQGCAAGVIACPNIACLAPQSETCVAADGSAGGTCTVAPLLLSAP